MIEQADLEALYRRWIAERQERDVELPSAADLLAYSRQELSPAKVAKVREVLVSFPELARALATPLQVPYQGKPGDFDYLSQEDLEQDWEAIQRRLAEETRTGDGASAAELRPVPEIAALHRQMTAGSAQADLQMLLPRKITKEDPSAQGPGGGRWRQGPGLAALAASLVAVVLGGLYFNAEREVKRLATEITQPHANLGVHALLPDGSPRGSGRREPITFSPEERFVVRAALVNRPPYPAYRATLVRVKGPQEKQLWSATGLERGPGDTFAILLQRDFLGSGIVRLRIYGLAQGREDLLATYTLDLHGS